MECDRVSSGSIGSAGGGAGRSARSSSSTQGVFLPNGIEDKEADNEESEQHMAMVRLENRVTKLEERVAAMEMKNKPKLVLLVCLIVLVVSVYVIWV
ncbi:hypothetical protein PIB30_102792 [Stylosanthes scabra]|uniref:Coiled-coil domain-containing protein 167 n=1 Tax=Stylosanthes scabra TaxID=79078 RepID=A0ABU6VY03_9FABA|nr:hypothetical protein [Stylosanthes scabra]